MATILRDLCTEHNNPFKLTLCAGALSFHNSVTWVYALEDDYLIDRLHGSEVIVTMGIQQPRNPGWLMEMVRKIADRGVAGLIVNTGKYIAEVPGEVVAFCDEKDLPLLTMPWEIDTTEMIQTFCTQIIADRQAFVLHDKALKDAVENRDNAEEYEDILSQYYNKEKEFQIILIYTTGYQGQQVDISRTGDTDYQFANQIRHMKTRLGLQGLKIGVIRYGAFILLCLNDCPKENLTDVRNVILNVYREAAGAGALFIGAGIRVTGVRSLAASYNRAYTALRMAYYRSEPYIHFEDMGFYKILFSVKDQAVLYSYADEILAPLDEFDRKGHEYTELLKAYIHNDRSLERTAESLFMHRNTVNYQIQKMKELLGSPLRTVEDLFPYQVALAIRDMQTRSVAGIE